MEYTVPNLEYAVSVFYNSEQNERVQAHQWLTAAQRCPEAWSFVWELLQPTKGTEVQFFAATTLHTKLLRCWHELPLESYEELKNKILHTILGYAGGPKIVLNRLCISLAAFILQHGATDLVSMLRPLSSAENMSLLLEVLTVIPEEFNSMTMGTSMRVKNRTALQEACPAVLDDMLRYLQSAYSKEPPTDEIMQTWCSAALCAASWLALDGDETTVREEGTTSSLTDRLPICHALQCVVETIYIHNEVISDTALEACEAALSAVRAAGSGPDAARYPAAALQLMSSLASLAQPIIQRDNVPNSINEELLAAIATCAVSLGECHARCLVSAAQQGQAGAQLFLEVLLASQAAPGHYPLHETRSQLVFGWWYTLQDEILYLKDNTQKVDELWPTLFSRLLTVLIQKSEAPSDDVLSKDDAELLRCYRQDVADTVIYCYAILGDWCWQHVASVWRESTTEAKREAALHVFLTLADEAPRDKTSQDFTYMLCNAINAATTSSDARLLNTALECLGAYATWFGSANGRSMAAAALRAAGVALPRAAPAAALALKKLCSECSELAAPLAAEIVMAVKSPAGRSDEWVRRQLLGAAGAALAAAADADAGPLLAGLARDLHDDLQQSTLLKRVVGAEAAGALIAALAERPVLAAAVFAAILPALPPYALHEQLVPALFAVLRQAICVLADDCLPMIEDIAQLTLQAMEAHPCASGVDVVKLIILSFGSQWAGCSTLLSSSISSAARRCAVDAASRCDLTEALFAALQAITKKKPKFIDDLHEIMPQLVDLGCECIRLWEAGAARAACRWLASLATGRPLALLPRAPPLTHTLIRCIGGASPRNQMEPLSDLLLSLNRASWGSEVHGLSDWMRDALATPGFPTAHALPQHKEKFIAAIIKEKNSKRRVIESVQEFSLVCRGLVGTEYARATLVGNGFL